MAQRFYQKASVQVSIVSGIALIIVTLITIAHQRSELKQDNKNLKTQVSELKEENSDLKRERDKFETQLSPFLAAADQKFPDAPPDQRLDLLIKKMDEVISTVQDAARKISPERLIPQHIIKNIAKSLEHLPQLNVGVTCILGDTESFSLATQIKSIFEMAGWKVHGVNQSVFTSPVKHLILEFGKKPSKDIQRALSPLFDFLGYKKVASLNKKLPVDNMKIIIGSK